MSEELIRLKNTDYARYEELLLRRNELAKEAFHYECEYTKEFGEDILAVFREKIDCIRKKKAIDFCRMYLNRGESVDEDALQAYLHEEMEDYRKQLEEMVRDHEAAKDSRPITQVEMLEIKRIYHRLVKKLHPDVNPLLEENMELAQQWSQLMIAYRCNNLELMREVEVMINMLLDGLNMGEITIDIPDIEDRIEDVETDIRAIMGTDPYQYQFLLADPRLVAEKHEQLKEELDEYRAYGEELDAVMEGMMLKGGGFTWRMN